MEVEQLCELVVHALEDVKGIDIRTLDVRGKSNITDVMVVASGGSDRQVKALADKVVETAKEHGLRPLGVEGRADWVLVDLGDVVVHVMRPDIRDFYNLEKLWGEDSPAAS